MTDQTVQRLRTSAHINRIFAKKAAAGAEDTTQSPDFYRGRSEAFDESADVLERTYRTVIGERKRP